MSVQFKVRAGQREFELGVRRHRVTGFLAERQDGKTTIASRIANFKMMKNPGHTVIFGSVKVDLGREIIRKESAGLQEAFRMLSADAQNGGNLMKLMDGTTGKELPKLSADDFLDLYVATRLEFRLYFSNALYSRTKVVALTPDAVGETGDLIMDEVGRCKNFRDVMEAVMPIIASNPAYRAIFTTTPPPDDSHPSFDLLAPPIGTELPISPTGNWYRSEMGVHVLRISAEDAYADGIPLYDDDTGEAITPAESRQRASNKDAWDRNYGTKFVIGGSAAIDLLALLSSQQRGARSCAFVFVSDETDFRRALDLLRELLGPGEVGIGFDVATTEGGMSNPSSVTITERSGIERLERLVVVWKERKAHIATDRIKQIVLAVRDRKEGGSARRLCVDASNERYFADRLAEELAPLIPVELVINSVSLQPAGYEEKINYKTYLGDIYCASINGNRVSMPSDVYLKNDHRLVIKSGGRYDCTADKDGCHGDTFDSGKLAEYALISGNTPFDFEPLPDAASDSDASYERDSERRFAL